MLNIANKLFKALHNSNIRYCVFKGVSHLDIDLEGGNGDLDILVSEHDILAFKKALIQSGFRPVMKRNPSKEIMLFIGHDIEKDKHLILHVYTRLRLGSKKSNELRWAIEDHILDNCVENKESGIHLINPMDEIFVLGIRMILKNQPKDDDLDRLEFLRENIYLQDNGHIIKGQFEQLTGIPADLFFNSFSGYSQEERNQLRKKIKKNLSGSLTETIRIQLRLISGNYNHIRTKIQLLMGFSGYQIRKKGNMIVLQGIDGCGKSTQSDRLKNSTYLQLTGTQFMYGGNNQYKLPGLNRLILLLLSNEKKYHYLRKVIGFLAAIDRRLRLLKAIFYIQIGKNVIFDRYFYDDVITYKTQKQENKKSKLELFILLLLHGWIGYIPELTIYLDINAEDAYKRKQDYPLEKVKQTVALYREIFKNKREVVWINAMDSPDEIFHKILGLIYDLDGKSSC